MKRILLVWQYYRKDFVEIFEELSSEFEFIFLAEIWPLTSTKYVDDFAQVIYWKDFSNADGLLNFIKPDKIIFMGLEGLLSISLNGKAKARKIPTFYLQHGLYSSLDTYIRNQKITNTNNQQGRSYKTFTFQMLFYLKTFGLKFSANRYLFGQICNKFQSVTELEFLIKNPIKNRRADFYLAYTRDNIQSIVERDKVSEDKILPIGIPKFDDYFTRWNNNQYTIENYILLIDTPLVEINKPDGNIEKKEVSVVKANYFYSKVNEWAMEQGLKLKIKLHPFSYASTFFIQHENIEYLKECDITKEILNSKYIVSFYSTLLLPVILTKKFAVIKLNENNSLIEEIENELSIKFSSIDSEKYSFEMFDFNDLKSKILQKYLYKTDGRASNRLINYLKS